MKMFGLKIDCSTQYIILFLILGLLLGSHLFPNCTKINVTKKEGMANLGANINWTMGGDNPDSWVNKAVDYSSTFSSAPKGNTTKGSPVPLPPGQLFMFSKNEIKPECCPSVYSSSNGCICMSNEQRAYLYQRGGNRTGNGDF